MAPIVGRTGYRGGRDGAIAQLGERVVRNDEVGGSIPPGSTTLRPLGFAWRGHVMTEERSVPGEAHLGEDGLSPKILLFVRDDGYRFAQPILRLYIARFYSAASDMIDSGMRLSQPPIKSFNHARSATSCTARPSK
jgi:hypothetical protein